MRYSGKRSRLGQYRSGDCHDEVTDRLSWCKTGRQISLQTSAVVRGEEWDSDVTVKNIEHNAISTIVIRSEC